MSLGYPPIVLLYLIPIILLSLSFHELAHAYTSYRLGDPTAKNMGRLTLNPLKHLDVLGTLMLVISFMSQGAGFGWAKPVPINPTYYRDYKKGTMLVSLAGPLSNILLAIIFSIPMAVIGSLYGLPPEKAFNTNTFYFSSLPEFNIILFNISRFFFVINIGLAVFNLIPVPPLDGSKILSGILPSKQYFKLMQYENYVGIIFLIVIFAFPGVLGVVMRPFIWFVETAIKSIVIPIVNMLI